MKIYSKYLLLPLMVVFALCTTSCDDDDDTFFGVWNVTSITQTVDVESLDTNASGTFTFNEDGTGSRDYAYTFTKPTGETLPITVIDEMTYEEDGDVLTMRETASGGILRLTRTINTNSKQEGTSGNINIDGVLTVLTITLEK